MRSSMTLTANRSSMFSGDMGCRHCDTEADETQKNLEICTGLSHEQRGLNMVEEKGKLILTNEDNLEELKKKRKLRRQIKNPAKAATRVTKATTTKTLSDKLKTATRKLADKRKKRVDCTSLQIDTYNITQGQEEETPTLHCEGLSCAV